ncbi:MAG: EAL domain-containing protein [Clostridiales bacterium]|nr:EAL domain-containing protein [Roseburia sp.]MDD7636920.1 EAL domain-containing protein [Clostridiales bacterium]MDY4113467.1 EAL domain-containing protein [Roseburia sp.]
MKSGYAIAFLFTVVLLCYGIIRTEKNENPIAAVLQKLLTVAALAVLANMTAMLSANESVCMMAYSVFFVCIDWILYYMLVYAVEYTGSPAAKWPRWLFWLVLGWDSCSMLCNQIFGHAFACIPVQTSGGEIYYRIQAGLFYNIHLGISYVLVVLTVLALFLKAVLVPPGYRGKYIVVLAIFCTIVIADAGYVFFNQVVDISILFFALGGYALYYYSVVYAERELISGSMNMVASGMDEALAIFNAEGRCTYFNQSAINLFGRMEQTSREAKQVFLSWCNKAKLIAETDYSRDVDFYWGDELLHLRVEYRCINDKRGNRLSSFFVIHDHTTEVNDLKKERYKATHDSLTGLYNKEYFYEQAAACIGEHEEETFMLVCADVKNFKLVNDVFGPEVGDEILVKIAQAIQEKAKPGEIYGRVESDRFALLMRKSNFSEQIFAEGSDEIVKIDCAVTYPVTIYVGLYEVLERSLPISVMCDRAFMAINAMKENGPKKFAYYDKQLRDTILEEQELNGEMESAIENNQFQMHLQPQIAVDGSVTGAEVLVRWQHPKRGLLMPGSFIEVFERSGQIVKLDQCVWEMACRKLQEWKLRGRNDMYLSVNISTRDFYFIDVYQVFTELIEKYDIEPKNLKLEITETAVMMNLQEQLKLIAKLRAAGFVIEMDDFGSGYSSLNMLKEICVDILKVDMAFLEKTGDEERGRKILKMVIELSKGLGMPVITEGVETEEQLQYLTEIGCDMFQGYYFAKPMEVEAFEQKYM